MNVLILFGGNSEEHNISCISAKSILEHIDYNKFKVQAVGINKNNEWFIFKDKIKELDKNWINKNIVKIDNIINFLKTFDVIFPIIHGRNGEDGKLQGMLELFDINFVGCNTLASSIGMDKVFSKIVFNHLSIPQVPYIYIYYNNYQTKDIEALEYPVIIKPANGGSSIGINKANNKKEVLKCLKKASKYDNKIIIEKFIVARELECAVIEKNNLIISDIGEIKSCNEFYDYNAKYKKKSTIIIPTILPKKIKEQIQKYAEMAFIGINAKDLARIDFFYDETNEQIYLNEINTLPGFTNISMYPKLIIDTGIDYTELISILINNAIK